MNGDYDNLLHIWDLQMIDKTLEITHVIIQLLCFGLNKIFNNSVTAILKWE